MDVSLRTRRRRAEAEHRRARRTSGTTGAPAPAPAGEPAEARPSRERRSGGPQDQATYSCSCGYVFEAAVSTAVDCPHCTQRQAW